MPVVRAGVDAPPPLGLGRPHPATADWAARRRSWLLALWAAAWVAGVFLQLRRAQLLPPEQLLVLAFVTGALMLLGVLGWRPGQAIRVQRVGAALLALASAAAGFASTEWRAAERLRHSLPAALEGRDLVVTGVVASLPRQGATSTRFVFEPETASAEGVTVVVPPRLQLGWYDARGAAEEVASPAEAVPRAGERWQLTVRLRRPHGAQNPHGFDYELWLWERQISATGYVRTSGSAVNRRLDAPTWGAPVQALREAVRDGIRAQVADAGAAGVVTALAVGDQAAIERDDWTLFRAVGIQHLVAISGLHITMLAWLGAALGGWCWRRWPMGNGAWMLHLPAPLAARWIGLAVAVAYSVLAGWAVPAQRTVWMLATIVMLRSLGLAWPMLAVLGVAGLVVVVADPWALMQPGFWLSFVAVAMLVVAEPAAGRAVHEPTAGAAAGHLRRLRDAVVAGLRTQAVATIGLAPLTLLFFHQVSVVGFVANLLAIPWITLVVTPLALAGMVVPPLWAVAGGAVEGLMAVLGPLASWPGALWHAGAAPPALLALGLAGGLVAVLPLPGWMRGCGLAMLLPLLAPPVERPPPGRFEAVVLDVGQGTSVLVRTTNHLLVYDAGPQFSAESEAGSRILLPLLRARGERRVDVLMLSHRDSDHTGGASALMAAMQVGELWSSLEDSHPLRTKAVPHRRCQAGQHWRWDGVDFTVLHPPEGAFPAFDAVPPRANALSCVLRVSDGTRSLLLTGDIEAAQEAALVARAAATEAAAGTDLASTVLVAPHHGSKTSSTPAFLGEVRPELALFQAGYRSRFGHPAPEVVARYEARSIAVVRSDGCGAWTWRSDAPVRTGVCERIVSRRYWHHPTALEQGLSGLTSVPE